MKRWFRQLLCFHRFTFLGGGYVGCFLVECRKCGYRKVEEI